MDHHDKDYFVPNFGVDHDVITTQSNLKNAEKKLDHTWELSQAEKDGGPVEQENWKRRSEFRKFRDDFKYSMHKMLRNYRQIYLGDDFSQEKELSEPEHWKKDGSPYAHHHKKNKNAY